MSWKINENKCNNVWIIQGIFVCLLCNKTIRDMKLGLVRMSGERVIGVQYFESKFSRELGEILRINGVEWRVGVIAEDRNSIIKVLNEIVRIQNSIVRKKQRELDREIERTRNIAFMM